MKKQNRTAILIVTGAVVLITAIVIEIVLMFKLTSRQTVESGTNRLEAIGGELEETINEAQMRSLLVSLEVQPFLNDQDDLREFIYNKKAELSQSTGGVCYNTYIAGRDWFIIPDFDAPADYEPTKRSWYVGAVRKGGDVFVSDPYVDALTGNICYTVSVLLNDKVTVLAFDYTMENIRRHILRMYSDGERNAVIVTEEGIIAGCTDDSLVGSDLSTSIPKYVGIFTLAKTSEESVSVKLGGNSLFASRSAFGWYLIVSENNWSLYKTSYIQMFTTIFISLVIFIFLIILLIMSSRSSRRISEALEYKEEFLENITSKLRTPLDQIITGASAENVKSSIDYEVEFEKIRKASSRLSDMINEIISYKSLVHTEKEEKKRLSGTTDDIKLTKRFRFFVLLTLAIVMAVSMYTNVTASIRWGRARMHNDVSSYEYQLDEWINTQKSILDMFCSYFSTHQEILSDYGDTVEFLNEMTRQYPEISVSYIANPNLPYVVYMNNSWLPSPDFNIESREWYRSLMASEKPWIISEPYYDSQTGLYCVTFAKRVYNDVTGEWIGNFGIDFYMDKLIDILGSSYSDQGYAFLADAGGNIINHPDGRYQMAKEGRTNIVEMPYSEVVSDGNNVKIIEDYDGKLRTLIATTNETSGFTVYVVGSIKNMYGYVFIYGMIPLFAFIFCFISIYRLMTRLMIMQERVNDNLRKSAEAAIAAGEAKTSFLAQMSHEIRTPINAVLGMNEMILRECSDSVIREYAHNIKSAGRTLLSLINSILDFSKIEDGKMEIISVEYETSAVINDLINAISPRAEANGLHFSVNIDPSLPSVLMGDDMRIRQIISNLLTNAVKYTEKGSVTFLVRGENKTDTSVDLYVAVIDTGIGIRDEDIDKLYESFIRLDEKRNRNIEGTGLGISIVTKLLAMMDSELSVQSVYGEGSTFSFRLRQSIVDGTPIGRDYRKLAVEDDDPEKERLYAPDAKVLIVDDNEMNLKVAVNLLKIHGIVPDTAISGQAAIELAAKNHYSIIFLDHMMPKLDGIETLNEMNERQLLPEDTEVIALTANAVFGAKEMYLEAGFSDYLSKPIEEELLEKKLQKYLPAEIVSYKKNGAPTRAVVRAEDSDLFTYSELTRFRELCPKLNVMTGMGYCMDSKEFYLDTLLGYTESDKREALEKAFSEQDIENYRILIHGVKSASLTIGAVQLSELAKALEFAARDGNSGFIGEHHAEFIKEYTDTLDGIGKVLKK